MKQLLFILLVSLITLVTGCSNDDSNPLKTGGSGNVPPNVPGNPFPHADTTIQGPYHIVFSWTGGDPNAEDTVKYDLYLSFSSPANDLLAGNLTTAAYDYGIPSNGSYYWRVVAKDQKGLYSLSPNWHFILNN